MDDTQRMIGLLRRLKVEMNGAVVDAMRSRGLDYPLSYGVSVPTIREIAKRTLRRMLSPCFFSGSRFGS